jgi:predicted pyridoxine 5'-phosphate oxidase superfamily flavin-nucleotide-binding protein
LKKRTSQCCESWSERKAVSDYRKGRLRLAIEENLMSESELFGPGSRLLQDRFDSRRIADRLEEVNLAHGFSETHREIIETAPMFFLATVDRQGRPDVSYKGGMPGFVRVTGPAELAFPDYNGNGMFKSLGAILENPNVGLLFIRWSDKPKRLRVLGRASLDGSDPLIGEFEAAQQVVRVRAERIFDNCPRYIHRMELKSYSPYTPLVGREPPIPDWKRNPLFRDALPQKDLALLAAAEEGATPGDGTKR